MKSKIAPGLRALSTPIAGLLEDPANVRVHDERNIEAIKASLARFGQQRPVVFDHDRVVVAGNGTLRAAKALGWTHVAAVKSTLAGIDRAAYAIADNRTAELASWDEEALGRLLRAMPADAAHAAGFDARELQEVLARSADNDGLDRAPAPSKNALSSPGDLWHLGAHRLLCGDSTKLEDVRRVVGDEKASLVATDPPYLVDYTGERPSKGNKDSGKDWSNVYHEIDIKDADGFFTKLFSNVLEVLADNAPVYCWHAHRRCGLIQRIWEELGILDHQQLVWVKPATVFGRVFYHFQHEPCMMGWRKGSMPAHDNSHEYSSVWELGWESGSGEEKAKPSGNEHPTQKPVEIFARPMRKHTKPDDLVFEPFSGSGSQLIAAETLSRRCRAIEIEPVFVDVAIRRWQTLTGQAATLGANGPTWDEVARKRCRRGRQSHAGSQAAGTSRTGGSAKRTPAKRPQKRGAQRKDRPTRGATERRGANSERSSSPVTPSA